MWSLESREDPSPLTQVSNKPDESRPYLFLSKKGKKKEKKKGDYSGIDKIDNIRI